MEGNKLKGFATIRGGHTLQEIAILAAKFSVCPRHRG